jgi:hypothetical protein
MKTTNFNLKAVKAACLIGRGLLRGVSQVVDTKMFMFQATTTSRHFDQDLHRLGQIIFSYANSNLHEVKQKHFQVALPSPTQTDAF